MVMSGSARSFHASGKLQIKGVDFLGADVAQQQPGNHPGPDRTTF
jgi:hypothetical protein